MNDQNKKWFMKRLKEIQSIRGYSAGESIEHAAQKSNVKRNEIIKLNSNENFFIPRDYLIDLLSEVIPEMDPRMYPQEEAYETKKALGQYLDISSDCIMIDNGSDPLISFITQLFLDRGDTVISIAPTFSLYKLVVNLKRGKYLGVPLKRDFSLDVDKMLSNINQKTRLIFLCSPNNPTSNQFNIDEVRNLVKEFLGLVIVDEAYVEYANYSTTSFINEFENLIVVRTFSKAFGLAGLRFGYAVSNPDIVQTLASKAQLPFTVNSIVLKMVSKILSELRIVKKAIKKLKKERERLVKDLTNINGVTAFDSQTNFILFRTNKKADVIYQSLLNQGLLIRKIGKILNLNGYLRTTVGLPEMNDKLLAALDKTGGE